MRSRQRREDGKGLSGQEATGVRSIPGSRVDLRDGRSLLLYPKDRAAWSRLILRLVARQGARRQGQLRLDWPDVSVAMVEGWSRSSCPDCADDRTRIDLGELRETFGRNALIGAVAAPSGPVISRGCALDALGRSVGVRCVAMGDISITPPSGGRCRDVLTAIREKTTIDALGFKRERFMDRALNPLPKWSAALRFFPMRSARPPTSRRRAASTSARSATNILMRK